MKVELKKKKGMRQCFGKCHTRTQDIIPDAGRGVGVEDGLCWVLRGLAMNRPAPGPQESVFSLWGGERERGVPLAVTGCRLR